MNKKDPTVFLVENNILRLFKHTQYKRFATHEQFTRLWRAECITYVHEDKHVTSITKSDLFMFIFLCCCLISFAGSFFVLP